MIIDIDNHSCFPNDDTLLREGKTKGRLEGRKEGRTIVKKGGGEGGEGRERP